MKRKYFDIRYRSKQRGWQLVRKNNFLELQTLFAFFICSIFLYNIITILEFLVIRKIQLASHCMRPKNEVVSDLVQFKFIY